MDVLSDVLRVVRLSGAVFFTAEFSAPWALDSPSPGLLASVVMPEAEAVVLFHILTAGECVVEFGTGQAARAQAGDAIVFPQGDPHTMRSHPGAKAEPVEALFSRGSRDELPHVSFGGGGPTARFVCGYLSCDHRFGPLFGALPTLLLLRGHDDCAAVEAFDNRGWRSTPIPRDSGTWMGTTLAFTINEAAAGRPGGAAMLGRLAELMFVGILREYMEHVSADQGGWFAGLNDPHIGTALRLLHAHPERNWTVDELAREAAISRSAFAQHFTDLVGEAPMQYLADWRMRLARQLLRESAESVRQVAGRVGYESEAAFNRAFKRATGTPPATWRRLSRASA